MSEAAKAARRLAHRDWQRNNPDKVREYNARYWEKKARYYFGEKPEAPDCQIDSAGQNMVQKDIPKRKPLRATVKRSSHIK